MVRWCLVGQCQGSCGSVSGVLWVSVGGLVGQCRGSCGSVSGLTRCPSWLVLCPLPVCPLPPPSLPHYCLRSQSAAPLACLFIRCTCSYSTAQLLEGCGQTIFLMLETVGQQVLFVEPSPCPGVLTACCSYGKSVSQHQCVETMVGRKLKTKLSK